MFEPDSLAALRQRVHLLEVLQSHLELKRSGSTYKALCPFHDEKSPSLILKAGDSHFHCFGCGAHGDAIDFLMRYLGMGFSETAEMLAERYGVHLEKRRSSDLERKENGGISPTKLKECADRASQFFHFWLLESQEGREALDYLAARQIDKVIIERFRLGLAPQQGGLLRQFLLDHSFTDRELRAAGLLTARGRDFFSRRILFPIKDAFGRCIAFSGRKFHEETFGGKYINSPDSPLFRKSRILFGLSECRRQMAKTHQAVIVEGQVDALRLIVEGVEIACAPLGTAFGEEHARELQKLGVRTIYLAFDADDAGHQAAIKAGHICLKLALDILVVELSSGSDPDGVICQGGIEAFKEHMRTASEFVDYLFGRAGNWSTLSPGAKQAWIDQTVGDIRQWHHPVIVHESLKRLAWLTKVPEAIMATTQQIRPKRRETTAVELSVVKSVEPERAMEGELLASLLQLSQRSDWAEIFSKVKAFIQPKELRVQAAAQLLSDLLKMVRLKCAPTLSSLISDTIDGDVARLLQEIGEKKISEERAIAQCQESLNAIARRNWMMRREEIKLKIQSGTLSDDRAMELTRELAELIRQPPPHFALEIQPIMPIAKKRPRFTEKQG